MRRIHKLVSNGSRKIQSLIGEQKTARKSSRRVMNELFMEMAPLEERVLMTTTIIIAWVVFGFIIIIYFNQ